MWRAARIVEQYVNRGPRRRAPSCSASAARAPAASSSTCASADIRTEAGASAAAPRIRDHVAAGPDRTRAKLQAALGLTVSLNAVRTWLTKRRLVLRHGRSTPEQPARRPRGSRAEWDAGLRAVPME